MAELVAQTPRAQAGKPEATMLSALVDVQHVHALDRLAERDYSSRSSQVRRAIDTYVSERADELAPSKTT